MTQFRGLLTRVMLTGLFPIAFSRPVDDGDASCPNLCCILYLLQISTEGEWRTLADPLKALGASLVVTDRFFIKFALCFAFCEKKKKKKKLFTVKISLFLFLSSLLYFSENNK